MKQIRNVSLIRNFFCRECGQRRGWRCKRWVIEDVIFCEIQNDWIYWRNESKNDKTINKSKKKHFNTKYLGAIVFRNSSYFYEIHTPNFDWILENAENFGECIQHIPLNGIQNILENSQNFHKIELAITPSAKYSLWPLPVFQKTNVQQAFLNQF